MNINSNISYTYLVTNKKMTMVAVMGVLLGMSIYIFMNSLLVGFDKTSNESIFKNTAHIRIYKDDVISQSIVKDTNKTAIIVNPRVVPDLSKILNPNAVIELTRQIEEVTLATPQISNNVFFQIGKTMMPGLMSGVIPSVADKMFNIRSTIVAGSFEKLENNVNSVALGVGLADKFNLTIGDNITIVSGKNVLKTLKIIAVFKTNNSVIDKTKCYVNISVAQQLLKENNSYVTEINVQINNPEKADEVAQKLAVLTGYKSESWKQANETMMAAFKMRRIVITFVSLTILIVAGFGIYNILNMTVSQKINDIAILKAIGFKGKDVVKIFLVQALSIGVIGVIGGMLMAVVLITLLKKVYIGGDIGYFPIDYEPLKFLQGVIIGLVITFFAGYLPAKKAAKVDPVAIFRK